MLLQQLLLDLLVTVWDDALLLGNVGIRDLCINRHLYCLVEEGLLGFLRL